MASTHYDPLFARKRQVLPIIIREELTPKQQQVIDLFYFQNLTDDQVAATLGITRSSAQRLRHRAEKVIAHYLRYCG